MCLAQTTWCASTAELLDEQAATNMRRVLMPARSTSGHRFGLQLRPLGFGVCFAAAPAKHCVEEWLVLVLLGENSARITTVDRGGNPAACGEVGS